MGILGFINLFRKASLFLLRCQEQVITLQLNFFLNKNKKHLVKANITVSADIDNKKEQLNEEIKNILKKYKNNSSQILNYITKHKTKVFKISNAKEALAKIGEEPGLIPAHTGIKAVLFNALLFKKFGLKSNPVFIIDDGEIDIYFLIHQFHRWYFMQNNIPGFDEKSQELLKQVNKGNEDFIIKKLTPDAINSLQQAVARDIESITFVEQYARENAGSKKALEKIKNGLGATI